MIVKTLPIYLEPRISDPYHQKIPKKIYQTFKTTTVTEKFYNSAMSYIEKNPEYTYEFFDDQKMKDYIYNYDCKDFNFSSKELCSAFESILPAAGRADLWRYLIIYSNGGVYADIDTKCLISLKEMIPSNSDIVTCISPWSNDYENPFLTWKHLFPQWFLIYEKKSSILKQILELAVNAVNTKTPIPNSEKCVTQLERYTGVCISNYVYRKIFNFNSLDKELRLKPGTFNIQHNSNRYTITVISDINVYIHEKNFLTLDEYRKEMQLNNCKHWMQEKIIFNI